MEKKDEHKIWPQVKIKLASSREVCHRLSY